MPLIKGASPSGAETDEYFNDVALLIQPNSQDSKLDTSYDAFSDASSHNCPVLPHGDGTEGATPFDSRPIGTGYSPYEKNGYYSVEFGDTTTALTIPTSTDLYPSTGDFSLEMFVFLKQYGGTQGFFGFSGGGGGTAKFMFIMETTGRVLIHTNGFGTQSWYSGDYRIPVERWTFLCFRKTDGNMELFANGKSVASSSWTNVNVSATLSWYVGFNGESTSKFNGYISNCRWRVGTISDGSMPSKPLTHEKGTKLLCCLGNNVYDQSIYRRRDFTILNQIEQLPAVRTFNPFNFNSNLFSPDGHYSTQLDGDSYLSITNHADFQFGTGDFTVSFWVWFYNVGQDGGVVGLTGGTTGYWMISMDSSRLLHWQSAQNSADVFTVKCPEFERWHFIEVSRVSGTVKMFIDGSVRASASDTTNYNGASGNLDIGNHSGSGIMPMMISNLRIVKGSGITTSTVPSIPLTEITNTKLLALQSNSFKDNSSSEHTIAWNGTEPDPYPTAKTPYDDSNFLLSRPDGHFSNYFDGSADGIRTDAHSDFAFGTNNFTVECFAKFSGTGGTQVIIDMRASNSGTATQFIALLWTGTALASSTTGNVTAGTDIKIEADRWHHLCVQRSGDNLYFSIDGVVSSTAPAFTNTLSTNGKASIGGNVDFGASMFTGYISNVRVVNGTAVYGTSSFTPPSSPLTAITNTKLLTSKSYAQKDHSSNAHLITVNADVKTVPETPFDEPTKTEIAKRETIKVSVESISSADKFVFNSDSVANKTLNHMGDITYRFDLSDSTLSSHPFKLSLTSDGTHGKKDGYYSTTFDGSEGLKSSRHQDYNVSNNDFTIEFWVYPTATGVKYFCGTAPSDANTSNTSFNIYKDANEYVNFLSDGSVIATTSTALAQDTWTHVAVVRQSGTIRIYQGGVQRQTATDSLCNDVHADGQLAIGQNGLSTTNSFTGSISNFHFINGTCKYPDGTTYTPPTAPTTVHSQTVLLCCQSSDFRQDNSGTNKPIEEVGTPTSGHTTIPFTSAVAGSEYTTDVTTSGSQGSANAYLEYKSKNGLADLHYYCSSHSGMGGKIVNGDNYVSPHPKSGSVRNYGKTGSHMQATLNSAIGTGDFQVSFWFNALNFASNDYIISFRGGNENVSGAFGFGVNASGNQVMYTSSYQLNAGTEKAHKLNWHFYQLRRIGNTCYVKLDGRQAGSFTYSDDVSRTLVGLGGNPATTFGEEADGWISDVLIETGSGLDRVPTSPRESNNNTKLLTAQFNGTTRNKSIKDIAFPERAMREINEHMALSSFSPYLPDGYWSVFFGHVDNYYLKLDGSSDYAFGDGDFQIEMFIRASTLGATQNLYDSRASSGDNRVNLRVSSSNVLVFKNNTTRITGTTALITNRWYHVCLSRVSGSTRLFLDGSQEGSTYSDSTTYINDADRPAIGVSGYTLGNSDFKGYISNLRVKKGIGVTSVTVPTDKLEDDSKTVFLGLRSNRLINVARFGNEDCITKVGHPMCLFESPVPINEDDFPYDATKHGGSMSFDGTNDGLEFQNKYYDEFDMQDDRSFCFEYWMYHKTYPSAWKRHWEQKGMWALRYLGSTGELGLDSHPSPSHGTNVKIPSTALVGEWMHIAVTYDRLDNKTLRMYLNGKQVDIQTAWSSSAWGSGTGFDNGLITKYTGGYGYAIDGNYADTKFTQNQPVYTENFTPRTSLSSKDSEGTIPENVVFLCHYNSASIFDASCKNTLVNNDLDYDSANVSSASVSTVKSKNGLGSIYIDERAVLQVKGLGSGTTHEALHLNTGEFTIEFFVYFLNDPDTENQTIIRSTCGFLIQRYGNEWEVGTDPTPQLQVAQSLSTGTWYYFAMTRDSSSTIRIYGGSGASVSMLGSANSFTHDVQETWWFGALGINGADTTRSFDGYLDQIRVTKRNRYGSESSISVPDKLFPRR